MYLCTNDAYTPVPEYYESVEDFRDMCRACFGMAPALVQRGSDWYDAHGLVLRYVG